MMKDYNQLLNKFDEIRSRYVYKAFDAAITCDLGPSFFAASSPSEVDAGSRSYRRAQRMANALGTVLPSTFERSRQKLFAPALLPFSSQCVSLLSFGSGVTVFLVTTAGQKGDWEAKVLKVFRKSLGRRLETLLRQVQERRATYSTVVTWYEGCSLVLPTHFMILHGPVLARPAVACVQPFVSGEKKDLFNDLSEDELVRLLEEHAPLSDQFRLFADRTLQIAEKEGVCVDLVGRNNLVLTGSRDQRRLTLIDLGVYDFARKAVRAPGALEAIHLRLAYLKRVSERLAG